MKAPLILLFLSFLLCISSCEKDKAVVESTTNFKALKNNIAWNSTSNWSTYSRKDKKFNVSGALRDPQYYQEEWLGLNFVVQNRATPFTTGQFSAGWRYVIGGDVMSDRYTIDSTAVNEIHITALDTIKKQITGTFNVRLVRDKQYSDKGETFQFTHGEFGVNYSEVE